MKKRKYGVEICLFVCQFLKDVLSSEGLVRKDMYSFANSLFLHQLFLPMFPETLEFWGRGAPDSRYMFLPADTISTFVLVASPDVHWKTRLYCRNEKMLFAELGREGKGNIRGW